MKNSVMRSLVFVVLGIALFTVSAFAKDNAIEKWSSFAFGLSFPVFILGITQLGKRLKPQLIRIKK
jgi:ABC-type dipeptide/oligopeptide/nickel transport system permease component